MKKLIKIIYKIYKTPNNDKKGKKTYVPDNTTYLKPHKAAVATPVKRPTGKTIPERNQWVNYTLA